MLPSEVSTVAVPYRHLGGIVFDDSGNGLLLASTNLGFWGLKGKLTQWKISRSGANYTLSDGAFLTSDLNLADTRGPFGMDYDAQSNRTLAAWRDVGAPRPMAVANKTGLSSGTFFSNPTFPVSDIRNGTDVAYDQVNDRFVVGFSGP